MLENQGKGADAEGLAVLEEDLRSPAPKRLLCFRHSPDHQRGQRPFVIMDTAPTRHTLLLLDATGPITGKWCARWAGSRSRDNANDAAAGSGEDQSHYRDACRNHAGTGSGRAAAGLTPGPGLNQAWVINNSLRPRSRPPRSPVTRARRELLPIDDVAGHYAQRIALTPLLKDDPVGVDLLAEMAELTGGATPHLHLKHFLYTGHKMKRLICCREFR